MDILKPLTGLAVALVLSTNATLVAAQTAIEDYFAFGGTLEAQQTLPFNQLSAVKMRDRDDVVYVSDNGRYVIVGTLYDAWENMRPISTLEDIRTSAGRIPYKTLGVDLDELAPFTIGTGGTEVYLFTDPFCTNCAYALRLVEELKDRFTFKVIAIPATGKRAQQAVRAIGCATDREAAYRALTAKRGWDRLHQQSPCNTVPLQKRLVTTKIVGINSVPTFLAENGEVHSGAGEKTKKWLLAQKGGE
jgi:thiol:disulfide interchange protein DsbC